MGTMKRIWRQRLTARVYLARPRAWKLEERIMQQPPKGNEIENMRSAVMPMDIMLSEALNRVRSCSGIISATVITAREITRAVPKASLIIFLTRSGLPALRL